MDKIDENKAVEILNTCYDKALDGISVVKSESVASLAHEYINKYGRTEEAVDKFISWQIAKCGTSGFLSGLGGVIVLPVTLPANITSVLYMQLRMIAVIAYINGYNPHDDQVRTMAYICLAGKSITDVIKSAGISVANKVALKTLEKLPGKVLIEINKKVGFRLITKFGEKGVINLAKAVPLVGGIVGGGFDIATTKAIAHNAKKNFPLI